MSDKKPFVVFVLLELTNIYIARAALLSCNVLVAEHAQYTVVVLCFKLLRHNFRTYFGLSRYPVNMNYIINFT